MKPLQLLPALPLVVFVTLPAVFAVPTIFWLAGFEGWAAALAEPGLWKSIAVAVISATLGTALAAVLSFAILAGAGLRRIRALNALLPPLLATPHAAMAVGFAFLIAPSGWLIRLISPWATGFDRPPLSSLLQDQWGLSLALGLALKELPFITLLALSAGRREALQPLARVAQSLGYAPFTAFLKVTAPLLLRTMTLPITIAFIYGLSAVDMGSVLGPTTPAPLSVLALAKLSDPGPEAWRAGLAMSGMLVLLTFFILVSFAALNHLALRPFRRWAAAGVRRSLSGKTLAGFAVLGVGALVISVLSLVVLMLWAFAKRWKFPLSLPSRWDDGMWILERGLFSTQSLNTLWLALISATLGLLLALMFLLAERRHPVSSAKGFIWTPLAILPLLVPQMTLVPAMLFLNLSLFGLSPAWLALWGHVTFTAAYCYLTLRGPLLSLDPRYRRQALALGRSRFAAFVEVELALLLRPLMASLAVALSVSVAAYLPTLTLGQGRIETFTVEAVAAATGGSRRVAAQYALAQTFWALVFFFGALAVPPILFRNRRE